jgi:phospholipid-binding lipoprotein MlaA
VVPEGPYLFLPVFGPSNPRDGVGLAIDATIDPFTWLGQGAAVSGLGWAHYTMTAIDQYERRLDDIESTRRLALDPYATFRTLYRQNRQYKIDKARDDRRATIPVWFKESATPDAVTYSPTGR